MMSNFQKPGCVFLLLIHAVLVAGEEPKDETINEVGRDTSEARVAKLKSLVRQARTDDGTIDLNVLIRRNIVDPSPVSDFNVSSTGFLTDIRGRFSRVNLYGLKDFTVRRIEVNLSKMKLSAEMFVPALSVVGDYVLDGSLTFVQISGDGNFWMNLTEVVINGHSLFYPKDDGRLEMGEVKLHSEVGDIQLHFENLMGGGTWSTFSNSLLNQLSELILDELKHSLLKELGKFLRTQFNDNIFNTVPPGFIDPSSQNVVDDILKKAAEVMVDNQLDPLKMPDFSRSYEQSVLFVTTRGEVNVTNGYLYGLTSLKRKGDVIASLQNGSLVLDAEFCFENLTATYEWQAKFFGISPSGLLDVQVKSIEGFLKLKQEMKEGSRLLLDTFNVTSVRHVWLDINGLGAWDYVMEVFINLVTNGLKMQIADAVSGPVKEDIQKQINSFDVRIV